VQLIFIALLVAVPVWLLIRLGWQSTTEPLPEPPPFALLVAPRRAHEFYVRGEGDRLLEVLDDSPLGEFVALNTAMGRYAQALASAEENAPQVLDARHELTDWHEFLLRINVAETLSELGRFDHALTLVSTPAPDSFLETGRRMTAAWVLTLMGRADEALPLFRDVVALDVGHEYAAEVHLARAFVELSLGHLDVAEHTLLQARVTTARASTARNLLTLEAELAWRRKDTSGAVRLFEAAAAHHWRWQGGAGLLRHGQLLRELGREAEARAAWERCLAQDPESLAAKQARSLLA
jgi:predicted negative regulator of RcsB-dependent stress response